jgi:hypothetical protein
MSAMSHDFLEAIYVGRFLVDNDVSDPLSICDIIDDCYGHLVQMVFYVCFEPALETMFWTMSAMFAMSMPFGRRVFDSHLTRKSGPFRMVPVPIWQRRTPAVICNKILIPDSSHNCRILIPSDSSEPAENVWSMFFL